MLKIRTLTCVLLSLCLLHNGIFCLYLNNDKPDWNDISEKITDAIAGGKELVDAGNSGSILDILEAAAGLASLIPGPVGAVFDAIGGILGLFGDGSSTPDPMLEKISAQLEEMTKTLDNIMDAVKKTQFIVKYEVRGLPLKQMTDDMATADDLLRNLILYNDTVSTDDFLRKCNDVQDLPIRFKNLIVEDSFELKSLVMSTYDKGQYADFAVNTIRLFFHSSFLRTLCISTRYSNATSEEREQYQFNLVNSTQRYMQETGDQMKADCQFYEFDAPLNLIEVEAEEDNGQTPSDEFGPKVFEKLKTTFPDYLLYFAAWDKSPVDWYHNSYYPYASNDETIVLKTKGNDSYVHYLMGKSNRSMLLYRKGSPEPEESLQLAIWHQKAKWCWLLGGPSEEPTDVMSCEWQYKRMISCMGSDEYVALGCHNGLGNGFDDATWDRGVDAFGVGPDEDNRNAFTYIILD